MALNRRPCSQQGRLDEVVGLGFAGDPEEAGFMDHCLYLAIHASAGEPILRRRTRYLPPRMGCV